MKVQDLKQLSEEELQIKLEELRKHLFELNFQRRMQTLKKSHTVSQTKKDISRILTVINERKNNAG